MRGINAFHIMGIVCICMVAFVAISSMYIHQEPLNNGHIVVSLMGAFGFAMFMGIGYIYQRELEQAGLVGNSGALDEHLIDN